MQRLRDPSKLSGVGLAPPYGAGFWVQGLGLTGRVWHAAAGGTLSDTAATQAIDKCARQLASRFDAENGGFGGAPKFPRPAEINLLLCDHTRASAGGATVESRASGPCTSLGLKFQDLFLGLVSGPRPVRML